MGDWIDAHVHFTDERIEGNLSEILLDLGRAGISKFILGGVKPEEWGKQKELRKKFPGKFFSSYGLHPWWVAALAEGGRVREVDQGLNLLREELARSPRECIALGETGLDYHPRFSPETHEVQSRVFRSHLELALEFQLPLVLHVVRAHEEALEIMRNALRSIGGGFTGIVHSFSGDPATARAYLGLGLVPSISAPVLTRKSGSAFEKLRQTVVTLGATEFVLETDSPDQPPAGESGVNHPLTLLRIADEVAALRGLGREQVLDQSSENLRKIFKIP